MARAHRARRQNMSKHPPYAALAEAVRRACLEAAHNGFEQASMDGLCAEGAIDVALDAIRSLDVSAIVDRFEERSA